MGNKKDELKKRCRDAGLKLSGPKAQLVERSLKRIIGARRDTIVLLDFIGGTATNVGKRKTRGASGVECRAAQERGSGASSRDLGALSRHVRHLPTRRLE